jgi:beta-lactamase regulating signal transducer with metallopeptidase domain
VTRAALILTVAFAAYAAISSVLALLVGVAWRAGYLARTQADPAGKANRLVALRITPAVLGFLLSAGVVLPVYLAFEPVRDYEPVGPIPIVLAAIGVMVVFAASCVAARTAFLTRRIKQQWLRSATALEMGPAAGVPAYVVDAPSPMVALVGVFSPRLIAARSVIDACSAEELAAIVAHERGHLHARDNFKRWLLTCAPDVMRWTRVHASIVAAWRDAAEFAADDAATRGKEEARVDLAALLLKIARLAPPRFATPAGVSTFADKEGLDRRVRRLLTPSQEKLRASWQLLAPATLGLTLLAVIVAVTSPADFKEIYEIVELSIAFGR